jgi:NAD(P)-dependent dehydrogenase (short-subunit alcohol dehydrogenase family)
VSLLPDLAGSTAFVTGASRGVGRVVAETLARAGADVALVARSAAALADVESAVTRHGARALALPADVTRRDEIGAAVARAERELGPLDLLVANAGTLTAVGPPWEVDPDEWWGDVKTSLFGAYVSARAVLPAMLKRGHGRIVTVSSYVATRPTPYSSGYAAGKAGVLALTEALAEATAPQGIAVFCVTPGFVDTELTRHLTETPEGRRWQPGAQTARRVDPERTGTLVARLASGEADALSGRFIHALDDLDELIRRADEIVRDDLYALRLRTFPKA